MFLQITGFVFLTIQELVEKVSKVKNVRTEFPLCLFFGPVFVNLNHVFLHFFITHSRRFSSGFNEGTSGVHPGSLLDTKPSVLSDVLLTN